MLVSFIFKLLNMAVMFAFIAYMIKKYVMPFLYHGFKHNHDTLTSMRSSVHELEQAHSRFVATLHAQEETIVRLKKSIEQWRSAMQQHTIIEKERSEKQSAMIQKQIEDRAMMRVRKKIEKQSMALALERAGRVFQQQFAHDDESGKDYNACLIKHVQKS